MSWRTPRFWLWLSAVALGVYLGLFLTVGDITPDTNYESFSR